MKRDFLFLLLQFLLFALYFISLENELDWAYPTWAVYIVISCMVIGFLILLLGIINLRKVRGADHKSEKPSALYFGGIYSYIRHPIYLGLVILMFFYALYVISVFKLVSTILLVVLLYFKSKQEEEALIKTYSAYKDYKKNTGRFFPKKDHNKS